LPSRSDSGATVGIGRLGKWKSRCPSQYHSGEGVRLVDGEFVLLSPVSWFPPRAASDGRPVSQVESSRPSTSSFGTPMDVWP
jgi:hypothetical protein